jgi:glycosyltransferase involved in cell wall biosynthesis
MRAIALLATYNEERFIVGCLEHLLRQNVEVYLIDNCSTDKTVDLAKRYLGNGLIGIESMPRNGKFSLTSQLERKQQAIQTLQADWFMHVDADEIRLPPPGYGTLADAFAHVEKQGFNAVNFIEYAFVPTQESPDHDHADYQTTMRWYYPFLPSFPHRLNAWKSQACPIDLVSLGGHIVKFAGLRRYPTSFSMRHYLALSRSHALDKIVNRAIDSADLEKGWFRNRVNIEPEQLILPKQTDLRTYTSDDRLDAENPWTKHFWQAAGARQ